MSSEFLGFPRQVVTFLEGLLVNNDKEWFEAHRDDYQEHYLEPAREFVVAMGERLRPIAPGIRAEPAVNKSIFRIYRDTRFSKDKTPYKTHLGIWLWEGEGKRMERPGFYFHLEPGYLMLAGGMHAFSREALAAYREAALDKKLGPELARAVEAVKAEGLEVGEEHYKRVPAGLPKDHPNAELLKFNGLVSIWEGPIPEEIFDKRCLEFCYERFAGMLPMHKWLLKMVARMD